MNLTCDTCGRIGNEDDGIEAGGPCQEPCDGIVRAVPHRTVAWLPGERARVSADYPDFDWDALAWTAPVRAESVEAMLAKPADESDDTRSEWLWFRLPNGDVIFGCFPQGDTYFEFEGEYP